MSPYALTVPEAPEPRFPPLCACCAVSVDPSNPRESHSVVVTRELGESDMETTLSLPACEPCQFHWTETSKETKVGVALTGFILLVVAIAFWKGKVNVLGGCLAAILMLTVMGFVVHFVFRQKLDPGCHSGASGPVEAKRTGDGKLQLTFWNPKFAREFGKMNDAPADEVEKIPSDG